jgi:hypothetical protein
MENVDVGDSMSIGANAGESNGTFFMKNVDASDSVTIGTNFGRNGSARIKNLTGVDHMNIDNVFAGTIASSQVGSLAIGDDAKGTVRGSTVTSGKFLVGDNAQSGFRVANTSVDTDNLEVGHGFSGTIEKSQIAGSLQTKSSFGGTIAFSRMGSLDIGDDAAATVKESTVTSGNLTIGEDAGKGIGNEFVMENVTVSAGNLTVGPGAGNDDGLFSMQAMEIPKGDVTIEHTLNSGPGEDGAFEMTDVDIGNSLSIDDDAGNDGAFTMQSVDVEGDLDIGFTAGSDGVFTMVSGDIEGSVSTGSDAGSSGGSFSLIFNTIRGDLDFNGTMDTCSANTITGTISGTGGECP